MCIVGSVEHGHMVVAGMGEEKFERAEGVSWKTFEIVNPFV